MTVLAALSGRRRSTRGINLVVDGNSISAYHYTSIGTFDNHLAAVPALAPRIVSHSCFAVSGHAWTTMLNHDVESAWADDATNVLVAWEGVNSRGLSVAAIEAAVSAYSAKRLSFHPWRMVYVSAQPVGGTAANQAENARLSEVDAAVHANPQAFGFDVSVNLRTAFPAEFGHDGTTAAAFSNYASLWVESTAGSYLHLRDAAKNLIAPAIASAVLSLA